MHFAIALLHIIPSRQVDCTGVAIHVCIFINMYCRPAEENL